MKAEVFKVLPLPGFQPFDLVVRIETEEELGRLWADISALDDWGSPKLASCIREALESADLRSSHQKRRSQSVAEFRTAVCREMTAFPTWYFWGAAAEHRQRAAQQAQYMNEINRRVPPATGQQTVRETPSQLLNRLLSRGEYP